VTTAVKVEPYIQAEGTEVWSLTRPERQLQPRCMAGDRAATSTAHQYDRLPALPRQRESGAWSN